MKPKYPIKAYDGTNYTDVCQLNVPAGAVDANGNVDLGSGAKVYVALVSETGPDVPTTTVIANTLGGTPVWARTSIGLYTLTLANAWTANKTVIQWTTGQFSPTSESAWVSFTRTSANVITVATYDIAGVPDAVDWAVTDGFLTITVYP